MISKKFFTCRMFGKRSQLVVLLAALIFSTPAWSGGRYFYEGDGDLKVEGGRAKLKNLSPRLIALLDFLQDRLTGGKGWIHIHSGYRSPLYNERLRARGVGAAKSSLHMEGMAADISLRGVAPKKLWGFIRDLNCCGAGYYAGEMVHVDTGPARFWESATSKVFTDIAAHNKQIFPTTEYDVYAHGERMDFKLARITEEAFEVCKKVSLVWEKGGVWKSVALHREPSPHHFSLTLPAGKMTPGKKLRLKVRFCAKSSREMPTFALSNPFTIQP